MPQRKEQARPVVREKIGTCDDCRQPNQVLQPAYDDTEQWVCSTCDMRRQCET